MATTAFSSGSALPGVSSGLSLPHNADAERTVLGAILVDNQAFNSAAEILTREDFYRDAHRRIFEGMATLAEKSEPIDLVTLKNELTRSQSLEAAGGVAYLAGLVEGVPRLENVLPWSRIIREASVLRNLIHASSRIAQEATEPRTPRTRSSTAPSRRSSPSRSERSGPDWFRSGTSSKPRSKRSRSWPSRKTRSPACPPVSWTSTG